jgi:hypothetical protein
MLEFEFAALFAVAALLILGGLAGSIHRALSLVKQLRADLAACPDRLELRYTITETVARWNDGTVVPLRPRQARLVARPALRAAA